MESQTLIQLIDVSHKIYYLDMRSQQHVFTLVNAMVSHELRNPLNSLQGQLLKVQSTRKLLQKLIKALRSKQQVQIDSILEKLETINESLGTGFKKISQSVKFIDYFVHDILDFSVLRKADENFVKEMKTFDIRTAVKEIVEIQEDKVEMKGIQLETEFKHFPIIDGEMLFLIKSDQKRLQQVLLNLYSNAIKFTSRGGKIKIVIELLAAESLLHVRVEDNGLGIKEEDKPNIFKQFSSFKDPKRNINTKGIGLGLVICKMIVEKYNGTIGFTSEYNQGSTFYFNFEAEEVQGSQEMLARG